MGSGVWAVCRLSGVCSLHGAESLQMGRGEGSRLSLGPSSAMVARGAPRHVREQGTSACMMPFPLSPLLAAGPSYLEQRPRGPHTF